MTKEQLYKRKAELLEMAMQINSELLAINQELKKLDAEPTTTPTPSEDK